ncbi:ArsR/SmtB family transcription factor [Microbacterium sp. YY-03]|uniref:ArsR/SmtB family transcription factor n=1 Tax=Microbacterium sp. YY-03 TaxID=3421636 RepID=UPI003D166956
MNSAVDVDTCTPLARDAISVEAATTAAGALKSIADPLRLRMLATIVTDPRGEACVCDLAELADVSQPTISHHLKVLKDSGWLVSERRGTWVYYRISQSHQEAAAVLLGPALNALTRSSEGNAQ